MADRKKKPAAETSAAKAPPSAGRRILVVDDDKENASVLSEALALEGYSVTVANNGVEALEKIESVKPELVMLDYEMPGLSGLETLTRLRQQKNYVAVLFLSGQDDERLVAECLMAGADDYVRKPYQYAELRARLSVRFRNKDAYDGLAKATEQLRELAEHDDVTGLLNMRTTWDRIDRELKRGRRYNRGVAAVMMDLDHFKEVNDNADHLFGTFVLKEIGELIRKNMREIDFAARYGGDEFLMVLTEAEVKGAVAFAERLRARIADFEANDGKHKLKRTASLGVSVSGPTEEIDARELVRRADHALYAAKEGGRNKVVLFEPGHTVTHGVVDPATKRRASS